MSEQAFPLPPAATPPEGHPLDAALARFVRDQQAAPSEEEMTGLWEAIDRQLSHDARQQLEPLQSTHVSEAITQQLSAYLDGERALVEDPAALEQALFQSPELATQLAELQAVSQALRQFSFRQEGACSIDVSAEVMARLTPESSPTQDQLSAYDQELLALWMDDEPLSVAQQQYLSDLLATNQQASVWVDAQRHLSQQLVEHYQGQQQAASVLDELAVRRLVRSAFSVEEDNPNLLTTRLKRWRRPVGAVAATLLLAVVSFAVLQRLDQPSGMPQLVGIETAQGLPQRQGQVQRVMGQGRFPWQQRQPMPGSSSGFDAPVGPEGVISRGQSVVDAHLTNIPSSEQYLLELTERNYSMNEFEVMQDL